MDKLSPNPRGLCQCGCGGRTAIAVANSAPYGYVKGQPKRYIRGHRHRKSQVEHVLDEQTGCWLWQGSLTEQGYGKRSIEGRKVYAHRLAYEREHGQIPDGFDVHHVCRNRACVNPDHLELLSRVEHASDGNLTWAEVREIRALKAQGLLRREIAERFDVCGSTVSDIVNHKIWRELEAA